MDHLDLKESAADLDEMVSADSLGQQGQRVNQDCKVFLDYQGTKEIVVTKVNESIQIKSFQISTVFQYLKSKVMLDQRELRDHEACRERMDPQA